ncbi:MAG: hypothetical protein J2O48_02960 [Solirubrobacterales bacterium]|nr:hypothetical protein [Solirubrobacterales bacterium]
MIAAILPFPLAPRLFRLDILEKLLSRLTAEIAGPLEPPDDDPAPEPVLVLDELPQAAVPRATATVATTDAERTLPVDKCTGFLLLSNGD